MPSSIRRSVRSRFFLLLAGWLVAPTVALGQETGVAGTVQDPGGTPLSGATVELIGPRGRIAVTTTDAEGNYTLDAPAPGAYTLSVTRAGLQPVQFAVRVGNEHARQNVAMGSFLTELVVTATRAREKIESVPAAITVVGRNEVQDDRKALNVDESLKYVPGVRVENELGSMSRTRIIIRGTGTRANSPAGSGIRGIKVLVDGIPKNNAGGSAQDLTNIDLLSVDHIEVLRGPSSALYGNQSGGVVNLITEEGPPVPFAAYRQTVGSYGLFGEHLKFGGQDGNLNFRLSGYRVDQTGYRQQSAFFNTGFDTKTRFTIDERSSLTAVVSFDRNYERSPGPLTQQQFDQDPRQASPTFLQNDVHALTDELRLGVIYRRDIAGTGSLELTGYYTPRHLGPFQQIGVRIPQDFTNRGGHARYLHAQPIFGLANRFTVGVEFQDTPITTGVFNSVTGAASSDLEEHATTIGAYALEELSVVPTLTLSAAARFDWVHFTSEDLTKAKGELERVYRKVTPKLGVLFQPLPSLATYATYSQGFEAPIIGELRITPDGSYGFNGALNEQTSDNYEIGARGAVFGDRLAFEAALFRQNVHDWISPSGLFPNNYFQNVGDVREYGVELGARVRPIRGVTLSAAYTYSDFSFSKYVSATTNYTGNRLPGIPQHMIMGEVEYRHALGLHAALEVKSASPFYFDDANTAANPRYTVVNLRAGYEFRRGRWGLKPFFAIANLTDQKYSEFALINDAARRYYNPLPGISFYGGLGVRYDQL